MVNVKWANLVFENVNLSFMMLRNGHPILKIVIGVFYVL